MISELILKVARNCWYKLLESVLYVDCELVFKNQCVHAERTSQVGLHDYNGAPGYVTVRVKCVCPLPHKYNLKCFETLQSVSK